MFLSRISLELTMREVPQESADEAQHLHPQGKESVNGRSSAAKTSLSPISLRLRMAWSARRHIENYSSTLCRFFHLLQLQLWLPNGFPVEFSPLINLLITPKKKSGLVSSSSAASVIHTDTVTAVLLIGAALILKIAYAFHYRIDSDESQHLHVVWSWTQGMLP